MPSGQPWISDSPFGPPALDPADAETGLQVVRRLGFLQQYAGSGPVRLTKGTTP